MDSRCSTLRETAPGSAKTPGAREVAASATAPAAPTPTSGIQAGIPEDDTINKDSVYPAVRKKNGKHNRAHLPCARSSHSVRNSYVTSTTDTRKKPLATSVDANDKHIRRRRDINLSGLSRHLDDQGIERGRRRFWICWMVAFRTIRAQCAASLPVPTSRESISALLPWWRDQAEGHTSSRTQSSVW